ncbi:MAG TPA: molybdopterin oxidoreductase [Acidiferrobacteraceae bacterium]|nr:molybdopterin oxidoreductase [Acidiferrobacteraceae bacterium]HEX19516.1 molybdopterin oxidoreductase [Acidiferrobacteraceae bacterium]
MKKADEKKTEIKEMTRRNFCKSTAFLGGSAILLSQMDMVLGNIKTANAATGAAYYPLSKPENIIYSVCLQCHTDCPIKVKIQDGVAVKIDGNPYSAQNMVPNLNQNTSPALAARMDAKLCPKGQAGVQSLYDPYRIVKVLKRNGPRGSGMWKTISFDKAVSEIVEGGRLFKDIGEDRNVDGLRKIYKMTDPKLSENMASDAKKIAKKKLSVDQFQSKYSSHLDLLIDPDHPDMGTKNNQFVFMAGRIEHGRKDLVKRWLTGSFGSVNFFEHTAICEQSHHIAYKQASRQYSKGKWGKPTTEHMKPDALNAEFIVYFGTGFAEANFGPTNMAAKITNRLVDGKMKIAVVDPRFSKSAAKASRWLPVKPGSDAACALAMIRWIIANERYDKKYLTAANKAAAKKIGETTWSDSTHLVRMEDDGPGKFLRAADVGLGGSEFVIINNNNQPEKVSEGAAVFGKLDYSGSVDGIKVKTAFRLLKEQALSKNMVEWSRECGVPVKDIEWVAKEFVSHGKRVGAEMYRGAVKHTNGYYNAQAVIALNILVGNIDHKGGLTNGGGHWHEDGSKPGQPFPLKHLQPNKLHSFGIKLTREGSRYEESTLFEGYPAKRTWFPFSGNIYQEVLPSAATGYPYPVKAVWIHMGSPALSVPAANEMLKIIANTDDVPLLIADDIVIGDSSMYADYIFPDCAVWERWGTPHTSPDVTQKAAKIRQPTVKPFTEVVEIYGEKQHCSMEAVLFAISEKLHLGGIGKDGFGSGINFTRPEDFYLKLAANIAYGDKAHDYVPDASADEVRLFIKSRRHFGSAAFAAGRWEKSVGSKAWKKVIYVLNRGGRWENFSDSFLGNSGFVVHKYAKGINLYAESVALQKHCFTGQRFRGIANFEPIKNAAGNVVYGSHSPYELILITYKDIRGGQSRTLPQDYWLSLTLPENYILINAETAKGMGLKDGDRAKIMSSSNTDGIWHLPNRTNKKVAGRIKAVAGMRPGVVAVSWSFGHWGYGSSDVNVDGEIVTGDKRRAAGMCPNAAMQVDSVLKNAPMSDPIGGSVSFFDTRVRLVKV